MFKIFERKELGVARRSQVESRFMVREHLKRNRKEVLARIEKFGLGLTDHLENITGKVDAEHSNSNITQGNSKFLVIKIGQILGICTS